MPIYQTSEIKKATKFKSFRAASQLLLLGNLIADVHERTRTCQNNKPTAKDEIHGRWSARIEDKKSTIPRCLGKPKIGNGSRW